jgi:IPTL-CTERM motif
MKVLWRYVLSFGAATLTLAGLLAASDAYAYTVTIQQVGANVVATGSGTLNLAAIPPYLNASGQSFMQPNVGGLAIGTISASVDLHAPVTGPTNFGSGSAYVHADSDSGLLVGITANQYVVVDHSYVGGNLNSSSTWNNRTIASLGLTPGTYTWTWGSGLTADSFTVVVVGSSTAVPTLSEWGIVLASMLIGVAALFGISRRA